MTVEYQIIFWRDIPAQLKVRAGSKRLARSLTERFQLAIDEAAMNAGLIGTDAYLAEWRTSPWSQRDGDLEPVADSVVSEIESNYTPGRLAQLAFNGGSDFQEMQRA